MSRNKSNRYDNLHWHVRTSVHGWVLPQPVPEEEKNNLTALDLAMAYLKISDSIALSKSAAPGCAALEAAHRKMAARKGH